MSGKFLDPLELEYLDGRRWKITAEFDYHLGTPDGVEQVRIPRGFVTDFASVPKLLWNVLPPTGSYGKAAVVHDWLYQKRRIAFLDGSQTGRLCDRREADHILFEAMAVLGTSFGVALVIWLGVRLGGWVPWGEYRNRERKDSHGILD